jgi:hypothetical protein
VTTRPPAGPAARRVPVDDYTAKVLAFYGRRRESATSVLHRAVRLLAQADGHLDASGRLTTDRDKARRT